MGLHWCWAKQKYGKVGKEICKVEEICETTERKTIYYEAVHKYAFMLGQVLLKKLVSASVRRPGIFFSF